MKRLFFYTKNPLRDEEDPSFGDLLQRTGANTGNIFFMRAVEKQLSFQTMGRGQLSSPQRVGENFDAIVIPAANWLKGENQFLGTLADRIERSGLPCIVIGLGAQASSDDEPIILNEGSKRFLRIVSERSHSVGVRGEFTAEVVASAGVSNVTVTGCPSYFWSLSRRRTLNSPRRADFSISVNASRNRRVTDELGEAKLRVERDLYLEAFRRKNSFVAIQTEQTEGQLALGEDLEACDPRDRDRLQNFLGDAIDINAYRNRFRVYGDVDRWLHDLAAVDLVIGTRLHGCLLGLAAGTPSILVTIDSRTREIARLFGLPHYPATSDRLYLGLEDLYRSTDFSGVLRNYPQRYDIYRQFLINNGLETKLEPATFLERILDRF